MKSIVEKLGITPGPWEASTFCELDNSYHVGTISEHSNKSGIKFKNNKSCDVLICDVWSIKNEEDRANAKLIASAPKMLEALISQNSRIEKNVDFVLTKSDGLLSDIFFENCETIKKITGKTWEEVKEIING